MITLRPKLRASQRSLAHLRKLGFMAEVVEKFVARFQPGSKVPCQAGFRKDIFGFIDILAVNPSVTLAVQTTSKKQMSAHLRNYRRDPEAKDRIAKWISQPSRFFFLHGWYDENKGSGKRAAWRLVERLITMEDLEEKGPKTTNVTRKFHPSQ